MTDTFLPPRAPSVQVAGQTTFRVIRTDFGDGYSQRAKDGLNTVAVEWALEWDNVTSAEVDTMVAFFDAKAGAESFFWTPPRATTQSKWLCTEHTRTIVQFDRDTLSAKFELDYALHDATPVPDIVPPPITPPPPAPPPPPVEEFALLDDFANHLADDQNNDIVSD
jgi:phage-related protein